MTLLTQVNINGIDVTETLISYEFERSYGDVTNQMDLKFNFKLNDLVEVTAGMTITVLRGWVTATDEYIFQGSVQSINTEAGIIKIVAQDKLYDLIKKEVNIVYDSNVSASAGIISEIFKDLVVTYGGLSADAITIQDSTSLQNGTLLNKFMCVHTDIFERIKALADMLDWQFYYRADTDKVYFEPKGFTSNTQLLEVGENIYGIPEWKYDMTEMVNDLTVVGASQNVETTETGRIGTTTGYTTTSVLLGATPVSTKVYADSSNPPTTLREGGVPNSSSSYYYSVDKENKQILPAEGSAFATNDYFIINFTKAVPIPVHVYSPSSITTYGTVAKTITYEDIRTVDDAVTRGNNYLQRYSNPFIFSTIKVKNDPTYNLQVGQLIPVKDEVSTPNISSTLVINKHRIRYPGDYDELEVGDKQWRMAEWNSKVMEALKRINEKQFENQDILTELVNVDNSLVFPIRVRPRYQKVIYNTIAGVRFILGNVQFGILGTSTLGGGTVSADVLHIVQQHNNTYTERFIDEDFKDNTTGTWSNLGYLEMT